MDIVSNPVKDNNLAFWNCPKCGESNSRSSDFCKKCGFRVFSSAAAAPEGNPKKRGGKIVFIILIILAVLAIAAAGIFYWNAGNQKKIAKNYLDSESKKFRQYGFAHQCPLNGKDDGGYR